MRSALSRSIALRNGTGLVGILTLLTGSGLLLEDLSGALAALILTGVPSLSAILLWLWQRRGAIFLWLKENLSSL
jgi:lysozyme